MRAEIGSLYVLLGLVLAVPYQPVINATIQPNILEIQIGQTLPVEFNLSTGSIEQSSLGLIHIRSLNPNVADVENGSLIELDGDDSKSERFKATVIGRFLGRTKLQILAGKSFDSNETVVGSVSVTVLRKATLAKLNNVFTVVLVVLLVINTFVMGLQLDWKLMVTVFRRPVAPAIAFACQYAMMPLIATACAFVFLRDAPHLQFGYFCIGCAPGGGASNFWTLLLNGNLDLSVAMTFCSNVAALAMMPFWLYTLGRFFFTEAGVETLSIPYTSVIISLLILIGPAFGGLLLGHFKPNLVDKSKLMVKLLTLLMIIIAVICGTISNSYVYYLLTWKIFLSCLILPWTGFALSYGISYAIGQDRRNCKTIAIETGVQNGGIAVVLLQTSLSPPESDLALVLPLCVMTLTPMPLIASLIVNTAVDCIKKGREKVPTLEHAESKQEKIRKLDEDGLRMTTIRAQNENMIKQ